MTTEASSPVRTEREGALLWIVIDRPQAMNSLNAAAHRALHDALDMFAAAPDLHVAAITGAGDKAFCVGSDLKERAIKNADDHPPTGFGGISHRFDLSKPVIAAVNGLAIGGGVEIVAACDLAIAADHAEFALPEPRVGLAALGGGGLQRLARAHAPEAGDGPDPHRPPHLGRRGQGARHSSTTWWRKMRCAIACAGTRARSWKAPRSRSRRRSK